MTEQKWTVSVDPEICDGYGVCQRMEKSIFQPSEDDDVVRIVAQPETPEVLERVRMAVRRCPKLALKLVPRESAK
ncbi:ferredoxin [Ramlibacter sp. WS9]|uniref:ferredoxin n=1 Tax=Ramlibacter sp. WS9 TaxID=1882741 RepID=UPI00114299CA|nr:ferredoxin [Ramlibacter sp. WS9]ROZ79826.1 ferredoxin [Ramlibacter sp. WS9]